MAPYCSGACDQLISAPVQLWPGHGARRLVDGPAVQAVAVNVLDLLAGDIAGQIPRADGGSAQVFRHRGAGEGDELVATECPVRQARPVDAPVEMTAGGHAVRLVPGFVPAGEQERTRSRGRHQVRRSRQVHHVFRRENVVVQGLLIEHQAPGRGIERGRHQVPAIGGEGLARRRLADTATSVAQAQLQAAMGIDAQQETATLAFRPASHDRLRPAIGQGGIEETLQGQVSDRGDEGRGGTKAQEPACSGW